MHYTHSTQFFVTKTTSLECMPKLYPTIKLTLYLQFNFQDLLFFLIELKYSFLSFWVSKTNFDEKKIFFLVIKKWNMDKGTWATWIIRKRQDT